jgi:cytochrome c
VRPLVGEIRHAVNNLPFAPPLFGYIRRAMPLDAPGSLSDSEVYSLVAFLLTRAGVLASSDGVLEAASLGAVEMPNRVNFVIADGVEVSVPEPALAKEEK